MKRKIIILLALLLISLKCFCTNELLIKAEMHYQNQDYQDAVNIYYNLNLKYPNNYKLLYNLANSYFKQEKIGKAICYYHKAKRLSPRNKDIKHNLVISKSLIVDDIEEKEGNPILYILNINNLISFHEFIMVLLILGTICNILWIISFIRKKEEFIKSIFYVFIGTTIIISLFFLAKIKEEKFTDKGIITSKKIAVKAGPMDNLSTIFFIHEGTEIIIQTKTGNWAEISLANGFIGWIHTKDYLGI